MFGHERATLSGEKRQRHENHDDDDDDVFPAKSCIPVHRLGQVIFANFIQFQFLPTFHLATSQPPPKRWFSLGTHLEMSLLSIFQQVEGLVKLSITHAFTHTWIFYIIYIQYIYISHISPLCTPFPTYHI